MPREPLFLLINSRFSEQGFFILQVCLALLFHLGIALEVFTILAFVKLRSVILQLKVYLLEVILLMPR